MDGGHCVNKFSFPYLTCLCGDSLFQFSIERKAVFVEGKEIKGPLEYLVYMWCLFQLYNPAKRPFSRGQLMRGPMIQHDTRGTSCHGIKLPCIT